MQCSTLGDKLQLPAGRLPFLLGRQPLAEPAGAGIRLVVVHVTDRQAGIERAQAIQGVLEPVAVPLHPVARVSGIAGFLPQPAICQPQPGIRVTAVLHEGQVLGVGDEAIGQAKGRQVETVCRGLVEIKPAAARPPITASLVAKSREVQGSGTGRLRSRWRPAERGYSGLKEKLYLMSVHSSSWCCCSCCRPSSQRARMMPRCGWSGCASRSTMAAVDPGTVFAYFPYRRPRQQATLRTRVLRADAVIVTVEQVFADRMKGTVAVGKRQQDEGLEEPAGMRQVPLGRAHRWHGLQAVVLYHQRLAQRQGRLADLPVARRDSGLDRMIVMLQLQHAGVRFLVQCTMAALDPPDTSPAASTGQRLTSGTNQPVHHMLTQIAGVDRIRGVRFITRRIHPQDMSGNSRYSLRLAGRMESDSTSCPERRAICWSFFPRSASKPHLARALRVPGQRHRAEAHGRGRDHR